VYNGKHICPAQKQNSLKNSINFDRVLKLYFFDRVSKLDKSKVENSKCSKLDFDKVVRFSNTVSNSDFTEHPRLPAL
jgi:hypothetical protein